MLKSDSNNEKIKSKLDYPFSNLPTTQTIHFYHRDLTTMVNKYLLNLVSQVNNDFERRRSNQKDR